MKCCTYLHVDIRQLWEITYSCRSFEIGNLAKHENQLINLAIFSFTWSCTTYHLRMSWDRTSIWRNILPTPRTCGNSAFSRKGIEQAIKGVEFALEEWANDLSLCGKKVLPRGEYLITTHQNKNMYRELLQQKLFE